MLGDLARRVLGYEGTLPGLRNAYRATRLWLQTTFKYRLLSVGNGVVICAGSHIRPNCVSIGDYTFIGGHCLLEGRITIGRFVMFASEVSIVGGDHRFDVVGVPMIRTGREEMKPVTVEDDVWIGRGAIVLHGLTIGEGSIVAAGAVVTRNVEPYSIVGGCPARVLRRRFRDETEVAAHRARLAELRRGGGDCPAMLTQNASQPVVCAPR